ncbi:hypothetical protein V6N12_047593 [Hibiscus sabdariffa]|uniref:Uncharacterized protein n=1 Tax=Hibiscus sabdariffa TaxID=183260 RepID=A0ABR1ZG01_9ROSI
MKSVIFGHSVHQASDWLPSPSTSLAISSFMAGLEIHPVAQELQLKDEEALLSAIGYEVQPPKKMISINDTIEEMA